MLIRKFKKVTGEKLDGFDCFEKMKYNAHKIDKNTKKISNSR